MVVQENALLQDLLDKVQYQMSQDFIAKVSGMRK